MRWLLYKGLYKPGHYYSPIPYLKNVHSNANRIFGQDPMAGININAERQASLLSKMVDLRPDFIWPKNKTPEFRYHTENMYFNAPDALSIYSMMRLIKPQKIIEIGSGFSSAIMIDTNERFLNNAVHIDFIEPFPERLNSLITDSDRSLNRYTYHAKFIQDIELSLFAGLEENDFLFIDSSHISKVGSDLNHILFQLVPTLKKGVYIHFHDIFYPLEYPRDWIDQGIFWNEVYLLRAFLMNIFDFEIILFNNYNYKYANQFLNEPCAGGSLWLRKIS